jgi:hypothetical protein
MKLKTLNSESILQYFKLRSEDAVGKRIVNSYIKGFDKQHFQPLVKWIVDSNHSFKVVRKDGLRTIFEYLNPSGRAQSAHRSANTAKVIAVKQCLEAEEHSDLSAEATTVRLAFDGWPALNQCLMYGIACFLRNKDNNLYKIAFGVDEIGRLRDSSRLE